MLRLDGPRDVVEFESASQTGRGLRRKSGALGPRGTDVSGGADGVTGAARAEQMGRLSGLEGVTGPARAEQMGRSLARVLTGTEALGGGVADRQTGAKAGAFAQSLSATWLPLLGGAHDYFGGLAPTAARASASSVSSLREAVGDLVKMAEAAVSASDTPIALTARRQVLKRATAVAERAASIEDAPRGGAGLSTLAAAVLGRGVVGAERAGGLAARVTETGREATAGAERASLVGERDGGALSRGVASSAEEAGSGRGFDRASAFAVDRIAASAAERISSLLAGAAGLEVEPGIFGAPALSREMRIGGAERTMVGLEREPAGLEARLAEALALAAGGPAGARRMMRQGALVKGGRGADGRSEMSLAGGRELAAARRLDAQTPEAFRAVATGVPGELVATGRRSVQGRARDAEAAESARVLETVMNGASPEPRQLRHGFEAMRDAALREETQRGLSVKLGSVMAPEAMLGGLRSPELSEAIRAVASRQAMYGFDVVPVLTTLANSGIDLEAARSSLASVRAGGRGAGAVRALEATGRQPFEAAGSFAVAGAESLGGLATRVGAAGADSSLAARSPEQALVRMRAEADGILSATDGGTTLGRQRKAGLLSAILRGTERAEMTALLEQAGGREFAFAWLNRVDGSRSGLDIGMEGTRREFGQAFGRRRDSVMAGESPIAGASLVDTSARKEDKSGLRSVAASVVQTATGAARPQHGASQAIRRTDWSFVDTGSRTTTPHADLTKLASAIIGSADAAQRAPMPLVAPAAKAIAQTALRDPTTKSAVKNTTAPSSPAGDKRGPVDAKMSEKAIEMLALEMAGRVARLMGLMNERRGVWS